NRRYSGPCPAPARGPRCAAPAARRRTSPPPNRLFCLEYSFSNSPRRRSGGADVSRGKTGSIGVLRSSGLPCARDAGRRDKLPEFFTWRARSDGAKIPKNNRITGGDPMPYRLKTLMLGLAAGALALASAVPQPATAQSGEPIRIGFGMALTGPLAANG